MTEWLLETKAGMANGTLPQNAMLITSRLEKVAAKTVRSLLPVAREAIGGVSSAVKGAVAGGRALWENRSSLAAGFVGGGGAGGGNRTVVGPRAVASRAAEKERGERGRKGWATLRSSSTSLPSSRPSAPATAQTQSAESAGEGSWFTGSKIITRTPPPASPPLVVVAPTRPTDVAGKDWKSVNPAASYLSSLFTPSPTKPSPPDVDSVTSPQWGTPPTFGESWRARIPGGARSTSVDATSRQEVAKRRIGSYRPVGTRPKPFPAIIRRGGGATLPPAAAAAVAERRPNGGWDLSLAFGWTGGVTDFLRGVGAVGAQTGAEIGGGFSRSAGWVTAWAGNLTDAIGGRGGMMGDWIPQANDVWKGVESQLDRCFVRLLALPRSQLRKCMFSSDSAPQMHVFF